MASSLERTTTLLVAACFLVMFATCWSALGATVQENAFAGATIVFITDGDACTCAAVMCRDGRKELEFFLAKYPEVSLEIIDKKIDEDAVREYEAIAIPTFILLDKDGEEAARLVVFFSEERLLKTLKQNSRKDAL